MSTENELFSGKTEAMLKLLEDTFEKPAEEPRRMQVLVVGSPIDSVLERVQLAAAMRGLDVVFVTAQSPRDRVLIEEGGLDQQVKDLVAQQIRRINMLEDFDIPQVSIAEEVMEPRTDSRRIKSHSIPKLKQFQNNQRSRGPSPRKQFAMTRPPRRGGRS